MEALVPAEAHGGGPFRLSWVFRTKEDWVAEKELLKEEHNVDMAVWHLKYQPLLPQIDPDGQCSYARKLLGWLTFKGLQGVTRMAYSPSLWLMAIGW